MLHPVSCQDRGIILRIYDFFPSALHRSSVSLIVPFFISFRPLCKSRSNEIFFLVHSYRHILDLIRRISSGSYASANPRPRLDGDGWRFYCFREESILGSAASSVNRRSSIHLNASFLFAYLDKRMNNVRTRDVSKAIVREAKDSCSNPVLVILAPIFFFLARVL